MAGFANFQLRPDKEELMALEPDLLITYDDESFYEEYSGIAPVILVPLSLSPEEAVRFLGEVQNIQDKAEEVIQAFNAEAKTAQGQIADAGLLGKTVVLMEPLGDKIWIYDNAYGRGGDIIYDALGFAIPDAVQQGLGDQHFMNISAVLLPEYCDADYIVIVADEGYDALKDNAVWQTIPAVQAGRVIEFDAETLEGHGLDTATLAYFTERSLG